MTVPPISAREALVLLLNAYRRPCHNLHDVREAELEEAEALGKARQAGTSPNDPPEFATWLTTLLARDRTVEAREATFDEICDYFDSEKPEVGQGAKASYRSPRSC